MNERMRELYQQTHMVREYPEDDPWRGGNPPTVYCGGERSAERFAELIVQECLRVSYNSADMLKSTNPAYSDGIMSNNLAIREHFGVEK
jgi:hypothetical protein